MADVLSALALLFEPSTFIMCFVGMLVGVILGAIPGLAAGLAITVMLPISFTMKSTQAFALLMSIWVGGCSGSFIGSILLGIPGTPSSLATTFDGYAMTKKGQATRALSIGTLSNFLGTAPSIIIAMIACPLIASVAVKMGPWEYFALSFMAITLVVSISKGNMVKGFIGAGMGLLLTQVGYAPISSTERFTFGSYYLASGFSMSCVMIGIFAGSLIIMNYAHGVNGPKSSFDGKLTGFKIEKGDFSSNIPNIIRSFLIGLGIGFLPGMGAALSNMVSYATAKNSSKHPEEFGTGIPDGIWAPEVANNASVGGAVIPMIALGVRRTVHPDTPCPDYCLRVVAQSQLDEELPEADLIALSLPGTPETNKLFNAERFARCKDGAILINVGRGTTVDSDALVEALRSGKIFGAGLDVTDPEPLPADHPLWGEPGAIITPHNSGKFSLPKTLDNIVDIFIHNLKRYAEGLPLDNQVDRTTRYAADQNGGHRLLSTL